MRLKVKVALITGSANGVEGELMGFGGAAARMFAREGATLVLADINDESGIRTATQIGELGTNIEYLRLDVTREDEWANAIDFNNSVKLTIPSSFTVIFVSSNKADFIISLA